MGANRKRASLVIGGASVKLVSYEGIKATSKKILPLKYALHDVSSLDEKFTLSFERIVGTLIQGVVKKNIELDVILSDSLVVFLSYNLQLIPSKVNMQRQLCENQFVQQNICKQGEMDFVWQNFSQANGCVTVLGVGVDKRLIRLIYNLFSNLKVRISKIEPQLCMVFNNYYDELIKSSLSAAMIVIKEDSWSLASWNERGEVFYAKGFWRNEGQNNEVEAIMNDVERISKSFASNDGSKSIQKVHVIGNNSDAKKLFDMLSDRLDDKETLPLSKRVLHLQVDVDLLIAGDEGGEL